MKQHLFSKFVWTLIIISTLLSCKKSELEERLIIHENEVINLTNPKLVIGELLNPASPLMVNGNLVFSESGAGVISKMENGKAVPLISGFAKDNYANYEISAQGITVEPESGLWIVCAAEAEGKIYMYDPKDFPLQAEDGRLIELVGAVDDNPWESVVIDDIVIASGGTSKQYQGTLDRINPFPLYPSFEVETGLIGIAKHPQNKEVYGAVFGIPPDGGSIIKWNSFQRRANDSTVIAINTIATGLRNIVDVAFLWDGTLLALEFGDFEKEQSGKLLIVDEKNHKNTPILEGLNSPSSFTLDEENKIIYISEFGVPANEKNGKLISLQYDSRQR